MKKLIFFWILLFSYALNAGELNTKLNADQNSIHLEYKEFGNLFQESTYLTAVIYLFDNVNSYPTAFEQRLEKKEKFYIGDFNLPGKNFLFALFKIGDGKYFDTKNFEYWELILNSVNGAAVQNTYYKLGLTYYGSIAPNIKRSVDLSKASEYFDKELSLYPNNVYAKLAQFSLKYENNSEKDEKYYNFLASLVKNFKPEEADDYSALNAIRILKAIGKEEKADNIEKKYARLNPKSIIAEQLDFNKLKTLGNRNRFNDAIIKYIEDFPNGQNFEKAFFALYDSYLQLEQLEDFKKITLELKQLSPNLIIKLVNRIENKSIGYDLLLNTFKNFKDYRQKKEIYQTEEEYNNQSNIQYLLLMESLISNFSSMITNEIRESIFNNDFRPIANIASDKFLDNYIDYFRSKSDYKKILELAEAMINIYDNNPKLLNTHKEYFNLLYKDSSAYGNYINNLKEGKKNDILRSLKFDSYNNDLSDAIVQNLSNEMINIKNYKGKIVLIEFWSTWLNSSPLILSSVDSMLVKNNFSDEVIFIPVSVWEKEKDIRTEISNFLEENNLATRVYYDNDNSMALKAGVTGIPARLIIDKSGKIRFLENGFTDIESYLENLRIKVEFLK